MNFYYFHKLIILRKGNLLKHNILHELIATCFRNRLILMISLISISTFD